MECPLWINNSKNGNNANISQVPLSACMSRSSLIKRHVSSHLNLTANTRGGEPGGPGHRVPLATCAVQQEQPLLSASHAWNRARVPGLWPLGTVTKQDSPAED